VTHPSNNRGKVLTLAQFTAMWMDQSLTVDDMAAALGITNSAVSKRARKRGLPMRSGGFSPLLAGTDFPAMWSFGVSLREMSKHFGVSKHVPYQQALRLGLPVRRQHLRIPMADYQAHVLAQAMAASAVETRAAMRDAEMIDGRCGNHSGKARVAG
jgi:hypothetical protein